MSSESREAGKQKQKRVREQWEVKRTEGKGEEEKKKRNDESSCRSEDEEERSTKRDTESDRKETSVSCSYSAFGSPTTADRNAAGSVAKLNSANWKQNRRKQNISEK